MTTKKKKNKLSLLYIFGGGILKEDFVLKHVRMLILLSFFIFVFIGNRYSCLLKIRTIDKLTQELKDVKMEALSISTELTSNSRQSQVEQLVQEQGLEIQTATTPAYELNR